VTGTMNDLARVRLKVIDRCAEAAVTILYSEEGAGGEQHLYLKVYPTYRAMLNDANRRAHRGTLVLEIVPADPHRASSGGLPEVGDLVVGKKGVDAVGEHPHRGRRASPGRDEFTVVDATAGSEGDADAPSLQRPQR
jgi:hypothetical protein